MFTRRLPLFPAFVVTLVLSGLTHSFAFRAPDENLVNNHEKKGTAENDTTTISTLSGLVTPLNRKLNIAVHGDEIQAAIDSVDVVMRSAGTEAVYKKTQKDKLGFRHINLTQHYKGLPVVGGEFIVHINSKNVIYLISGKYLPAVKVSIDPAINADTALQIGLNEQQGKAGIEVSKKPILVIYGNNLAYHYVISHEGTDKGQWWYYVDAHTGKLIFRYNNIQSQ